jgi:hypothetical protein
MDSQRNGMKKAEDLLVKSEQLMKERPAIFIEKKGPLLKVWSKQ